MPDLNLITHLRHVGLAMPQLDEQRAFYGGDWGLTEVAAEDGVYYYAAEGSPEPFVVRLRQDDHKRADVISFGVAARADIDRLFEQLTQQGAQIIDPPHDLASPGGGYGVRFFDGDGRTIEVSAEVAPRAHRQLRAGGSLPEQLSHCVLNSPDPAATVAWYEQNLGFQVVETGEVGDRTMLWFMRCSHPQHHVLAIAAAPHVSIQHLSFDLPNVDDFLRGVGRLRRGGATLIWGPGRHMNGDNTFAYFLDAAGNPVEYTTGMAQLDESWELVSRDITDPEVIDIWGTANPYNEDIMRQLFNTPDQGLFVAPPA